jgi:predicted anti-sigma-YlaC factor YlaD
MTMTPQHEHNHEQIRQRVFASLDGELPEAEIRTIQTHLEGCSDCRAAAARWATLARVFFRPLTPPPSSSDFFVRRVMARVEAERREHLSVWEGAWRWLVPALGVGVAALALVVTTPRDQSSLSPVSIDELLLASRTDNGAFNEMMQQDIPDTEAVLGLALEQSYEQPKEPKEQ